MVTDTIPTADLPELPPNELPTLPHNSLDPNDAPVDGFGGPVGPRGHFGDHRNPTGDDVDGEKGASLDPLTRTGHVPAGELKPGHSVSVPSYQKGNADPKLQYIVGPRRF